MSESAGIGLLDELKRELSEIVDINRAINVLDWDQNTYMPPGGSTGRADSLATLQGILHARYTSAKLGELLNRAQDAVAGLDPDSDDFNLVRVAKRYYDRQVRIPEDLVSEIARTGALAYAVWVAARRNNDYASFAPWLQKNIDLARRLTDHIGYSEHRFDALVEEAEPGMTTASVRAIFSELRPQLVNLVQAIAPQVDTVDDSPLRRTFDEATQERLGREVSARFGYDYTRGRLDRTTHPFEITFGRDDVRITTRYDKNFLPMALMGTMHESGHGLYEQGIAPAITHTPLGHGVSHGVHESQSRLWENYVGRSLPFWQYFYPVVQDAFPGVLGDVDVRSFYRALNKVHPSLIRVEADEVTYGLHIMLRFEFEIGLLDGTISVKDAPEAWNAAMGDYLGITPSTDALGILQDVHWSGGFGGFQGYALGNIIAAQVWESVLKAHPDLPDQLRQGQFSTLLDWLHTNIYHHGRKFDPADLIQRATGAPLSSEPYMRYLRNKFGGIYTL
ncbi:MAG: Carboxypeptidase Taq [Chloroflexi bacterium]|nr:Carboxypeptidase Taq [Chloroflexota bacterium]